MTSGNYAIADFMLNLQLTVNELPYPFILLHVPAEQKSLDYLKKYKDLYILDDANMRKKLGAPPEQAGWGCVLLCFAAYHPLFP